MFHVSLSCCVSLEQSIIIQYAQYALLAYLVLKATIFTLLWFQVNLVSISNSLYWLQRLQSKLAG